MTSKPVEPFNEDEFDWIQLKKEFGHIEIETKKEKMVRKIKENPFVPIGCLATLGALSYGLWSFRTGNRRMSQMMMRTRIAAQGFTVVALIIGVGMSLGTKLTTEEPEKK